jgi:hypothetical protein
MPPEYKNGRDHHAYYVNKIVQGYLELLGSSPNEEELQETLDYLSIERETLIELTSQGKPSEYELMHLEVLDRVFKPCGLDHFTLPNTTPAT